MSNTASYQIKLFNKIADVGLDLFPKDMYACSETAEQYDAVLVRSANLHETDFPNSLQCIARAGAGVNNIPLESCAEKGIVVFNTPGANANAVKELVIAALLMSSRKLTDGIAWAKTLERYGAEIGPMAEKGKANFAGPEIMGKRLGVIGLGAIGIRVANAAIGLGMDVMGYDPFLSVDAALALSRNVHHTTDLNEIFKSCDYITVHVPLLENTRGIVSHDALAMAKDGVRVINLARGELVDEKAMLKALESGKCACFVTDFATEAMLKVKNTIVFPHLGASTGESEDNCAQMAVREIRDYLEKGIINNSVNFPNLKVPREAGTRICMIHRNRPNMIGEITAVLSGRGVNIENMGNRSRGDYAYTIMDVNTIDDAMCDALRAIDGMIRLRVID